MGTIYFVIKNSIVTVVIVTLLQVSLLGKTIEDRIMNVVRGNFAVRFLGTDHLTLNEESLDLTPEQISKIRERFGESKFMKLIQSQAKAMIQEELKGMASNPAELAKEIKKIEQNNKRKPAQK